MSEPRKKDQGSLLGGFLLGGIAMAVGVFAATRFVGDSLFGEANARGKAIAVVLVLAPLFFCGQRVLSANAAGRLGEARGIFFGLACGTLVGFFLSFGVGFRQAGL